MYAGYLNQVSLITLDQISSPHALRYMLIDRDQNEEFKGYIMIDRDPRHCCSIKPGQEKLGILWGSE